MQIVHKDVSSLNKHIKQFNVNTTKYAVRDIIYCGVRDHSSDPRSDERFNLSDAQ